MSKVVICIPNHHPNLSFLGLWPELRDQEIIIMQDNDVKPYIPNGFTNVTIFNHDDVKEELGKDAWIIPKQTSACRSYAYYKAWQRKPDYIITLDNDCFPEQDNYFINQHIQMLESPTTLDWVPSNGSIEFTRGYPYLIRNKAQVYLNHGLWSNVPDLDAASWLQDLSVKLPPYTESHVIPRHNYFPMCGMNLAWRTDLTSALYFGLFGPEYGFDQYDDLWAGVLAKKVIDYLGFAARSGIPSVEHRKQSDAFINLKKQTPGLRMNEDFWKIVDSIKPEGKTVADVYESIIKQLPEKIEHEPDGWTKQFKKAALVWVSLYKS